MSDLASFLGGVQAPKPAPPAAPDEQKLAEADAELIGHKQDAEDAVKTEAPFGVVEVELPSGIQVYYQEGPKRLYKVRQLFQPDAEAHNWVEVPSMSTVTKILDKPGLVHWGEKVGINLVQQLVIDGKVDLDFLRREEPAGPELRDPPWYKGEHLQELGKQAKLTNYFQKDAASTRGNAVHKALEAWAMSGDLPVLEAFPEAERQYVAGLRAFLEESGLVAKKSEVIVASVEHRVAGRFDLVAEIPKECNLVYHLTGKSEKRKPFRPCSILLDLKTSKGVYEEYHLQTAGYHGCMVESGYDPPDKSAILRVTPDGRYELVECAAEWLDFWMLRGAYDALEGIKKRAHQNYRKELK